MPAAGTDATAAALARIMMTEDGRRMRLADEETLRYFRARPLRPPMTRTYSAELIRRLGLNDGELDTLLRAYRNEQNGRRIHADVLQQYHASAGHA